MPGVLGAAPALMGKALVTSDRGEGFITIKGIDPAARGAGDRHRRSMTGGRFDGPAAGHEDALPGILIGKELGGSAVGAFVGDSVTLVTPQGTLSPMGLMPRQRAAADCRHLPASGCSSSTRRTASSTCETA